ncbi:MAG: hypothetical protein ACRDRR_12995 [Pseudonocardiaceae bacterium]
MTSRQGSAARHVTVRKGSTRAWNGEEAAMDWWGWVILALVIVVVLAVLAVVVQRKRRRGGVIGLGDPGRSDPP